MSFAKCSRQSNMSSEDLADIREYMQNAETEEAGVQAYIDDLDVDIQDLRRQTGTDLVTETRERDPEEIKGETVDLINQAREQRLAQGKSKPRGYFNADTNEITLTPKADLSTFVHESAHFFLETYRDLSDRSPEIKSDLEIINNWAESQGKKSDRDVHELFASSFENYLREGKSPSQTLKTVFDRFKQWLTFVYKNMSDVFGRNGMQVPEFSPEVRDVFDRLLATQQEIEVAQREQYGPSTVDAFEMTPKQALEYQVASDAAALESDAEITKSAMDEIRRQKTKFWQGELKKTKQEVEQEISARPEYKAKDYLTKAPEGEPTIKINSEYLKEVYGEKVRRKLQHQSSKDGSHPDDVASIFGYNTGDELVNALNDTMTKAQRETFVNETANNRMKDIHGDMMTDGTIRAEAQDAVHNTMQAKKLALEIDILNSKVGKNFAKSGTNASVRASYKFAAEKVISNTPISKIKPNAYLRNEQKHGREAIRHAADGKWVQARASKERQLKQFYLYRAAHDALVKADKDRTRINKMQTTKYNAGQVHKDYIQALKLLLSAYDTRKNPADTQGRLKAVNDFIAAQKEANPDLVAGSLLSEIVDWRNMSPNDLSSLRNAAENLLKIGKANSNEQKAEFAKLRNSIVDHIEANTKNPKIDTHSSSVISEVKRWGAEFDASHTKLETLILNADGGERGPLYNAVFKPLWDAQLAEVSRGEAEHKELAELFADFDYMFNSMRASLRDVGLSKYVDTYDMPVGGMGGTISLTRGERLVLALNWGNEGNREALRLQQNRAMDDAQVLAAISTLNKEELQLVNKLWEYVDKFYPEVSKVEQEATGIAPAKVEASPFEVNGVQMRGGYYPLMGDSNTSFKQSMQDIDQRAEKMKMGGSVRSSTKHGSTIERVDFGGKDVTLSIDGLFKHVDGVVHDISHRKAVMDSDKILRSEPIKSAISGKVGKAGYKAINDTITRLAAGQIHPSDLAALNKIFRWSRMATSFGAMGYSVRTALANVTGVFTSAAEVGNRRMATSIMNQMSNPNRTAREVEAKSEYMTNRAKTLNRDIYEVLRNLKGNSKWNTVKANAFWMVARVDAMVSRATWMAAYDKAQASGMTEKESIFEADRTVVRTQSSGLKIDLSAVEDTSEAIKAISPMYTYFNAVLNMVKRKKIQLRHGKINRWEYFNALAMILVVPALVEELMFGGADEDEDSEGMAKRYTGAVASFWAGQWFGVRELGSWVKYGQTFDTPMQSTLTALPMAVTEMAKIAASEEEDFDKATLRALTQAAPVLGFPSGAQVNRTIGFLMDLEESGEDISLYNVLLNPDNSFGFKAIVTGKLDKKTDLERVVNPD